MAKRAAKVSVIGSERKGFKVVVDPPLIPVHFALSDVTITWAIAKKDANRGWRFKPRGIVIDQGKLRQFYGGGPAGRSRTIFEWKNRNTIRRKFQYTVHLANISDGTEADSDPAIQNQADS